MDNNNSGKNKFIYAVSLGIELGLLITFPLVVFLLIGIWLDRKFDTSPIFIILFVFLSLLATFLDVRYIVLPFLAKKVGEKNSKIEIRKK